MLKIITSVVLSLVTIMAVTLFAVTVPAQSQKIDENAAAIVKAQTDAETNAYNKVKEDILSDMSGSTLEDVGTAISALQDDVADLEDKKLYLHSITIIMQNYSIAFLKLYLFDSNEITENTLKTYLQEIDNLYIAMECSGRFFESGSNRSFVIHGIFIYQDNICFVFYDTETLTSVSANVATFTDIVLNV